MQVCAFSDQMSSLVQTCVGQGKPLKRQDYEAIVQTAESYAVISVAIPKIKDLSECAFVDRAFTAIATNDCTALTGDTSTLFKAALLAAFGLTFVSFLFCACFECALQAFHRCFLRPCGRFSSNRSFRCSDRSW